MKKVRKLIDSGTAKVEGSKNFTCGKCKRVVPFRKGYRCIYCDGEMKNDG